MKGEAVRATPSVWMRAWAVGCGRPAQSPPTAPIARNDRASFSWESMTVQDNGLAALKRQAYLYRPFAVRLPQNYPVLIVVADLVDMPKMNLTFEDAQIQHRL